MSYEDYEDFLGEDTFDYVEDAYTEADDLAEHAVPSPPHMNEDLGDFDVDHWQYDYWQDIDYASDGDEIRQRQHDSRKTRKRKALTSGNDNAISPSKKRKILPVKKSTGKAKSMDELPTVVMIKDAVDQRGEAQDLRVVDTKLLKSSALFKDWKDKFRDTPMFAVREPGVQLELVEDVADEDEGFEETQEAQPEDDEWEDEGEGGPIDLDPEALKHAIALNLKAAGINTKGMDEQTIMAMAMKIFSGGDGGADDLIGELADQLLGGRKGDSAHDEEDEDEDAATEDFAGWVQRQAEEKAAHKNKDKECDLPTPTDSVGKPSASPPDKRVKVVQQKDGIEIKADVEVVEADVGAQNDGGVSVGVEKKQGVKRKAESVTELDVGTFKKAARRFDAPTAASQARSVSVSGSAPVPAPATSKRKGRKG